MLGNWEEAHNWNLRTQVHSSNIMRCYTILKSVLELLGEMHTKSILWRVNSIFVAWLLLPNVFLPLHSLSASDQQAICNHPIPLLVQSRWWTTFVCCLPTFFGPFHFLFFGNLIVLLTVYVLQYQLYNNMIIIVIWYNNNRINLERDKWLQEHTNTNKINNTVIIIKQNNVIHKIKILNQFHLLVGDQDLYIWGRKQKQ